MADLARPRCVILGGGGHGRVLIDCLQLIGSADVHGVLDPNAALHGSVVLDVPILGGDALLEGLAAQGVTHFVVGLGGTRDNKPRAQLFDKAGACGLRPLTVIHPSASVSRWATLGEGAQVLPLSVVNALATLGRGVIVNSGAVVEHDCQIGDHVHVATGAILASTVRIGARSHIGAGATIRQGIQIGEGAVVGAGAVVVKDVAAGQVVVGVPARPVERSLSFS